jgi:hypothetical protein
MLSYLLNLILPIFWLFSVLKVCGFILYGKSSDVSDNSRFFCLFSGPVVLCSVKTRIYALNRELKYPALFGCRHTSLTQVYV